MKPGLGLYLNGDQLVFFFVFALPATFSSDDGDDDDDNDALAKSCYSHTYICMLLAAIGLPSLQLKITSLACNQQIFQ